MSTPTPAFVAELVSQLSCPVDGSRLSPPEGFLPTGVPWEDGALVSEGGRRYPIRGGILRMVEHDDYAESFGVQWRRYAQTQLDSYTGVPLSRRRLERCLGADLSSLAGKRVLELGSGAGRFTECLIESGAHLVSADLSAAVDANLRNCRGTRPYVLIQTDINSAPFPRDYFDVVFCLGVIQHTPDPEETIRSLAAFVRPGGELVIDHYGYGAHRLSQYFSLVYPVREVLKRAPPDTALRATIALTALCDPIRRHTCKVPLLDKVAARLLPTACYYARYPELDPTTAYEWNELDTHDMLTESFKHRRSPEEIEAALVQVGLEPLAITAEGNGVEARARRPA